MKSRTLILMGVAVVCGLVASYLTSRMLAQQTTAQEQQKVTVLVAKAKIPMGTQLKEPEKFFVTKEFPAGTEPKRAFKSFDEVKDRRLNKTISAEVFITPDDLMSKTDEAMAGIIPMGMRAFALSVKSDTNVAGFVLPLMRVDVLGTIRTTKGPLAKILLQDVLILGVDAASGREEGKQNVAASTVTIQVKPEDAERLTAALATGDLRLVLRGQDDHLQVKTNGVRPIDLLKDGSLTADANQGDGGAETEQPAPGVTTKLPDTPPVPVAEGLKPTPPPEPETSKHVLTILNGETVTKATYVLDKKTNQPQSTEIQKNKPEGDLPRKEKPEVKPEAEAKEPVDEVK